MQLTISCIIITYKIYIKPVVNSTVAPLCVNNSCQEISSSEVYMCAYISANMVTLDQTVALTDVAPRSFQISQSVKME